MAQPSPFITKLSKYFPIVEGVALAGFAAGYVFKIMHYPGANELIIISLTLLAMIYYMGAYVPPEPQPEGEEKKQLGFSALLRKSIVPKVMGIGLSVTIVGTLFAIMKWNGFREMLLIGSSSLAIALAVGVMTTLNNEQDRDALKPMLMRALFLMLVGFYLLNKYGLSTPMN